MAISRNALCPCGSGKKYKKCCLLNEQASRLSLTREVLHAARDETITKLAKFSAKKHLEEEFEEVIEYFSVVFDEADEASQDAFFNQLILPWYLYCRHEACTEDGTPISIAYEFLQSKGYTLDGTTQRYLKAAIREPLSFWQVEAVEEGAGVLVRDLITDREAFVRDISISRSVPKWDIILAQIVGLDGEYAINTMGPYPMASHRFRSVVKEMKECVVLEGATNPIAPERLLKCDQDFLGAYRLCLEEMFDPPIPEIRNTDGDKLMLTRTRFDFADREHVLAGLREMRNLHEEGDREKSTFVWIVKNKNRRLQETVKGSIDVYQDHLITDCNSTNRDKRLCQRLEKQFAQAITRRNTTKKPFEPTTKGADETGDEPDGALDLDTMPSDAQKQITALMEQQFMGWKDEKIPMLNHRTPSEVVETAGGREQVAAMINDWENQHLRMSGRQFTFDFNKLRSALGLELEA